MIRLSIPVFFFFFFFLFFLTHISFVGEKSFSLSDSLFPTPEKRFKRLKKKNVEDADPLFSGDEIDSSTPPPKLNNRIRERGGSRKRKRDSSDSDISPVPRRRIRKMRDQPTRCPMPLEVEAEVSGDERYRFFSCFFLVGFYCFVFFLIYIFGGGRQYPRIV